MAKNLITRQQYKNIKKMDHVQMSDFFTRVWQDGFNDGIKAGKKNRAAAVKPGDIEKAIAGLKGIGEVKLKAIMQQVYKLYEEAGESDKKERITRDNRTQEKRSFLRKL